MLFIPYDTGEHIHILYSTDCVYPLNLYCLIFSGPYSVTQLQVTQITTNAVTLVWNQQESKSYSYLVQVTNSTFPVPSSSLTVYNTTVTITGLLSGSNYNFTVTTQTVDGTQAAPITVSNFTRMYILFQKYCLYIWIFTILTSNLNQQNNQNI